MASKKATRATKLEAAMRLSRTDGTPEGWVKIVELMCEHFGLPVDLSPRSALRKVYGKLDTIYPRMKREFDETPDHRIKGAIVDIYTQLSTDAILRNQLFQYGFLGQLVSLVADPQTRNLAIDSLVTITHHGGVAVRMEVAKAACRPLLRILKDGSDDPDTPQLAVRALAHSILGAVSIEGKKIEPSLPASLPLAEVAQAFLDALRGPHATPEMVGHIPISLVEMSKDIKLTKPMLDLLVAGLRFEGWYARTRCLSGLLVHYIPQSIIDPRTVAPTTALECVSHIANAPTNVRETMQAWGLQKTVMFTMVASNREFAAALGPVYASGSGMYEAGKKIAELVVGSENAFTDGNFPLVNPVNGQRMLPTGGPSSPSPLLLWSDMLPVCAQAIRDEKIASETHLADALDLKFMLMRRRYTEAIALARRALTRNPDFAYPYYILMLAQTGEPALRAAKRGLQCTPGPQNLTPFLRWQFLHRGSELACNLGMVAIDAPGADGNPSMDVGVAMIMKAVEDWEAFVKEAPPDHRDMRTACSWLILLRIMTLPRLSDDLRELQPLIDRLKFCVDFNKWLHLPILKTQLSLVAQATLDSFPTAWKEWGKSIASVRNIEKAYTAQKMEVDLAAWMAGLPVAYVNDICGCGQEHGDEGDHGHEHEHGHAPAVRGPGPAPRKDPKEDKTQLYRCSFCSNPSAVLRKCAGCSEARYCDESCQKQHWKAHKRECRAARGKK
uniref:SET and MYND-domain-containing protein 3 n=1 Tax=Mycena chlorophos TaxID=658473 RepID=A0ABQ0LDR4_MYCCL|nr:SET and MYND-domain-containing protein 3 [Mycena chlorophos]